MSANKSSTVKNNLKLNSNGSVTFCRVHCLIFVWNWFWLKMLIDGRNKGNWLVNIPVPSLNNSYKVNFKTVLHSFFNRSSPLKLFFLSLDLKKTRSLALSCLDPSAHLCRVWNEWFENSFRRNSGRSTFHSFKIVFSHLHLFGVNRMKTHIFNLQSTKRSTSIEFITISTRSLGL